MIRDNGLRWGEMRVTYVLRGGEFGIEAGFCVLGLAVPAAQGEAVKP